MKRPPPNPWLPGAALVVLVDESVRKPFLPASAGAALEMILRSPLNSSGQKAEDLAGGYRCVVDVVPSALQKHRFTAFLAHDPESAAPVE
ncbi:MAG: hypothetical protein ACJ74Z_12635 [Bryobacteraceae bacterium]